MALKMMVQGQSPYARLHPAVKVKYCLTTPFAVSTSTKDFCVLNQYIFCALKMIDWFAAASADRILQLKMKCAFILKLQI